VDITEQLKKMNAEEDAGHKARCSDLEKQLKAALQGKKIGTISLGSSCSIIDEGGGLFRLAGGVKLVLESGAVIENDPLFVRMK
jgi:hypothetical protein